MKTNLLVVTILFLFLVGCGSPETSSRVLDYEAVDIPRPWNGGSLTISARAVHVVLEDGMPCVVLFGGSYSGVLGISCDHSYKGIQ